MSARGRSVFEPCSARAARRRSYGHYLARLHALPDVTPLFPLLAEDACPHSMPVLVPNRDALATALQGQGIAATAWWAGFNQHHDWTRSDDAKYLKNNVLSLPLHQGLGEEGIDHIIDVLSDCLQRATDKAR
ncbi:MAG: hypothetical protein HC844_06060 [Tabrizicola sp.]|nr:hypothetical protein [Tabrizicola sp.]